MTFSIILGVIEILSSFRLVLERKTGTEIKIRVLRKALRKQFCFIRCIGKQLQAIYIDEV